MAHVASRPYPVPSVCPSSPKCGYRSWVRGDAAHHWLGPMEPRQSLASSFGCGGSPLRREQRRQVSQVPKALIRLMHPWRALVEQLPAGNLCPYSITRVNSLRTTARRPAVALEERGVDGGQHGQQRAAKADQRGERQPHLTAPVIACCIRTGNSASHVSAIVLSHARASVPGWLTGPRV